MAYNHHSFLILLGYEYKSTYSTTHILTEFKEFHSSKFDVLPLNSKFLFNIGRVSTLRVRTRNLLAKIIQNCQKFNFISSENVKVISKLFRSNNIELFYD